MSCFTGKAVGLRGQGAVGRVAQSGALGNVDTDAQLPGEQLRGLVHHGSCQLALGCQDAVIRAAWGRRGRVPPLSVSVTDTGIADALYGRRIVLTYNLITFFVGDDDGTSFRVELEGGIGGTEIVGVKPDDGKGFGCQCPHRNRGCPRPLTVSRVTDSQPAQFHGLVCGIIQFYPSVEVKGRTDKLVHVRGHHLVDDERAGGRLIMDDLQHDRRRNVAAVNGGGRNGSLPIAHGSDVSITIDCHHSGITAAPYQSCNDGILGLYF